MPQLLDRHSGGLSDNHMLFPEFLRNLKGSIESHKAGPQPTVQGSLSQIRILHVPGLLNKRLKADHTWSCGPIFSHSIGIDSETTIPARRWKIWMHAVQNCPIDKRTPPVQLFIANSLCPMRWEPSVSTGLKLFPIQKNTFSDNLVSLISL